MQQLFSVTIGTVVDIITIATVVIVNFYRQIIEPKSLFHYLLIIILSKYECTKIKL